MNISVPNLNLRGILGKAGSLRSYSSLLLPLLIVIIAAGVFGVSLLLGSSFRKEVDRQSIPMGRQVKSLSRDAVPVGRVDVERSYQEQFERDANEIGRLARQTTQRELLSYKMFPSPKDTSMLLFDEFGRRYQEAIEGLAAEVEGRDCPTDTELDRSLLRAGSVRFGGRRGRLGLGQLSPEGRKILEALCSAKAESALVYVTPSALAGYDLWGDYKYSTRDSAVEDCWYGQLGYWIIEDIFSTVGELNSGSTSIYTSPVKRILEVTFSKSVMGVRGGSEVGQRPVYVRSSRDGVVESFTGRLCNDDIDVVHFRISVVVSTEAILGFMKELCSAKGHQFRDYTGQAEPRTFKHNQITILDERVRTVSFESDAHKLYRYGDDSVVELQLTCEYLFYKDGYEQIKPESVKESQAPEKQS